MKVLQSHYQRLGSCSVDDAFNDNWKQEVDSKVTECIGAQYNVTILC